MGSSVLYIYGVRHDTEPRALRKLFEPFGAVTKVDTPFGRPFAFVTMSSRDEAQAAVAALNGSVSDGRQLQVSFKRQPRTSSLMMSPPPSSPPPAPIKTPPTAYVTSCMQVACVSADTLYTSCV